MPITGNILLVFNAGLSLVLCLLFPCSTVYASSGTSPGGMLTDAEAEAWLEDDSEFRSLEVNEGKLTFIGPLAARNTLHSAKELTITEHGLHSGWVELKQCYSNITAASATDIVYRYRQIRNLKITSVKNIGRADAEGQVVHLHDITAAASICIAADINVIEKTGERNYVINSGPYYQQLLDGYYPYHVSLAINYPGELLEVSSTSPSSQPLFDIKNLNGRLSIDTWFEGVLHIQIVFTAKTTGNR